MEKLAKGFIVGDPDFVDNPYAPSILTRLYRKARCFISSIRL